MSRQNCRLCQRPLFSIHPRQGVLAVLDKKVSRLQRRALAILRGGSGGAKVCIVEREERPGGILKQCIHDGFDLLRFQAKLSGPEYAHRYITMILEREIPVLGSTFTLEVNEGPDGLVLTLQNSAKSCHHEY